MAAVGEFAVEVSIEETISTAVKAMGYSSLTAKQEEVVRAFAKGIDVFVSLPTGSGKSLCYCILPLVFDSLSPCLERSPSTSAASQDSENIVCRQTSTKRIPGLNSTSPEAISFS